MSAWYFAYGTMFTAHVPPVRLAGPEELPCSTGWAEVNSVICKRKRKMKISYS